MGYNDIYHQYGAREMKSFYQENDKTDKNKNIHLIYQAKEGNLKEIRRLVALGMSINYKDYDQRTALHLAANHGHFDVVKYVILIYFYLNESC